jgi:hypothetical protein
MGKRLMTNPFLGEKSKRVLSSLSGEDAHVRGKLGACFDELKLARERERERRDLV